jgi:LysM repeat protein
LDHVLSLAQHIKVGKYLAFLICPGNPIYISEPWDNEKMNWIRHSCTFVTFLVIYFLAGCKHQPDYPLPASPLNLVPYLTRTPVFNPTPTLPATETPFPSPTPKLYSIISGDTLSKVAERFGVSLDALLATNPGIQPAALSIGQTITIPSGFQNTVSEFLSIPALVNLGPVSCFSSIGGMTCLAPAHNPNPETLENVKVQITLFGENGEPLDSQEAILPLNILQTGQSLPAYAFFRNITLMHTVVAQLKASIPIISGDNRYIQASLQNLFVSINWDGSSAQAQGQVILADGQKPASLVWLAAIAYGADGQPIGFRRWEWSGSLSPGASQPFAITIYSLGPAIDHVDVLVEARP